MDTPIFKLQPSIINALLPMFLIILWRIARIAVPLYLAAAALSLIGWLQYSIIALTSWLILILLVGAVLPLLVKIIIFLNTEYRFYQTHMVKEFKFFIIRSHSITYDKVTNVSIDVSLWDRVCNAGDVTLHTADDDTADLTLQYIKDPQAVQDMIRHTIGKKMPEGTPAPASLPRASRGSHQRAQ